MYDFTDDRFTFSVVCSLANGTNGLQEETGIYRTVQSQIQFTSQQATCPAAQTMGQGTAPWAVTYKVSANQLTLTFLNDQVILARNTPIGGAQFTFGCFAADGTFTPRYLLSL